MRCRFCNTQLPDDARFCSGCGREVERKEGSTQDKKNSNEPEDAYYREIDDVEYEEIKKKEKEEERQKEEAAKAKVAREKKAREEAERRLREEKRAREEEERRRREEQRVMEESRRQYEEEQRRWKESLKKQEKEEQAKRYQGYDTPSKKEFSKMTKKERMQKTNAKPQKKSSVSVLVYLIIILVGGFALYKCGFPEMLINNMGKNSSVSKEKDSLTDSSKDKKNSKKTTAKKDTEETTDKEKKSSLADTDNSSMDVSACLSADAYDTVNAEDGSFSFGYPKYLLNQSEVNEDGTSYTLSYKEGEASKTAEFTVYTESNEGNALENAKQLYQRFSSQVNKIYFKMQPTRIDNEGMARTLIGASVDSSETTGVYIIAANDGEKNYILKFTGEQIIQYSRKKTHT